MHLQPPASTPLQSRRPGETAQQFAERVQRMIAGKRNWQLRWLQAGRGCCMRACHDAIKIKTKHGPHHAADKARLRVAPWDGYLKYYNLGDKVRGFDRITIMLA